MRALIEYNIISWTWIIWLHTEPGDTMICAGIYIWLLCTNFQCREDNMHGCRNHSASESSWPCSKRHEKGMIEIHVLSNFMTHVPTVDIFVVMILWLMWQHTIVKQHTLHWYCLSHSGLCYPHCCRRNLSILKVRLVHLMKQYYLLWGEFIRYIVQMRLGSAISEVTGSSQIVSSGVGTRAG